MLLLLVLGAVRMPAVEAHPVAQGTMEVVVFPNRVAVLATVSNEEVLIAAASRGEGSPHRDAVLGHADYLLAHLHITADGIPLAGRVVGRPESPRGRPSYRIEYKLPSGLPERLALRQDVLREIAFAPGTPWEASYLVRIGIDGQGSADGLLTCREPLQFDCRQSPGPGSAADGPPAFRGPGWSRLTIAFVGHGILHILTGYDHLLFVGALLLGAASLWDVIKVISAFTLAHTLTLLLSAFDVFRLPGAIVEPMIAASIVVVAVQNAFYPEQSRGRARLLVVFGFGLFHGLGFAGGLLEAMSDLGSASAVWAIAAFSGGVEIGHQIVVLPAFATLCLLRRARDRQFNPDRLVRRYGSAVISVLGLFYFILSIR